MIEVAKEESGIVGVVVPLGVLFRGSSEGKIREQVIKETLMEAVIGLPANLFFGTGIPASILIFNKQRTNNENTNVLFIDASEHYQSGTNHNVLREEDIKKVVDTYEKFVTEEVELGVLEDKYR